MAAAAEAAAGDDAEAPPAKKGGKKKLIVLVALVLLLVGAGAGLWFGGILPPLLGMGKKADAHAAAEHGDGHADGKGDGKPVPKPETRPQPVFMDLPEIIANLNAGPRRNSFIKLRPKLELAKAEDERGDPGGDAPAARPVPDLPARDAPRGVARFRRHPPAAGGTDRARQHRRRAANRQHPARAARHRCPVRGDPDPMSGSQEEEDLAAAWGAAMEEEGASPAEEAAPPPDATRVLNQAEIDSLLGFESGPAGGADESGIPTSPPTMSTSPSMR